MASSSAFRTTMSRFEWDFWEKLAGALDDALEKGYKVAHRVHLRELNNQYKAYRADGQLAAVIAEKYKKELFKEDELLASDKRHVDYLRNHLVECNLFSSTQRMKYYTGEGPDTARMAVSGIIDPAAKTAVQEYIDELLLENARLREGFEKLAKEFKDYKEQQNKENNERFKKMAEEHKAHLDAVKAEYARKPRKPLNER
jgi:hypothetical protein